MLLLICSSGCGTARDKIDEAARQKARADVVDQAIAAAEKPVEQPKECGLRVRSGVVLNDPLHVATVKTDNALGRANDRIVRCYEFNQRAHGGRAAP